MNLIVNVVDGNNTVCGNTALHFKKKAVFAFRFGKATDLIRFRKEPILRGLTAQGRMDSLVIAENILREMLLKLFQFMEFTHVQGSKILCANRQKPTFYLGFIM